MSANLKYKQYQAAGGQLSFRDWLNEQQSQGEMEVHEDKKFFATGSPDDPVKKAEADIKTEVTASTKKESSIGKVVIGVFWVTVIAAIFIPIMKGDKV
jgi:hypothetical protein